MRMNAALKIAVMTVALTCSACHNVTKEQVVATKKVWVGKKITDIMKQEGEQPSRVINAPDGTSVYVWSTDRSYNTGTSCSTSKSGYTSCYGGNNIARTCEISAFVDKKGIKDVAGSEGCAYLKFMGMVF